MDEPIPQDILELVRGALKTFREHGTHVYEDPALAGIAPTVIVRALGQLEDEARGGAADAEAHTLALERAMAVVSSYVHDGEGFDDVRARLSGDDLERFERHLTLALALLPPEARP